MILFNRHQRNKWRRRRRELLLLLKMYQMKLSIKLMFLQTGMHLFINYKSNILLFLGFFVFLPCFRLFPRLFCLINNNFYYYRYDLLCLEGISRALLIFLGKIKPPTFTLSNPSKRQRIIVKPEVRLYFIYILLFVFSLSYIPLSLVEYKSQLNHNRHKM